MGRTISIINKTSFGVHNIEPVIGKWTPFSEKLRVITSRFEGMPFVSIDIARLEQSLKDETISIPRLDSAEQLDAWLMGLNLE
ncbi:hypothetical protein AB7W30_20035 [Providencia manganoxydans]|uniref:hypothetical protein n=1 Tax=Providencia manganoxydans TaxID=2923283 RepID=UPI0032D9D530